MITLDTDLISLLQQAESPPKRRLLARLASLPRGELTTTIITYEEQVRGWMGYLARAKSLEAQVEAYGRLLRHTTFYQGLDILPFDTAAATEWTHLRSLKLKVGTMDLKIAAIALTGGVTLLSRNLSHFRVVPGLTVEDWSA